MTLFEILELLLTKCGSAGRQLPFKIDKTQGQTPLHYAFKVGNLEVAIWTMQLVKKDQGFEAYAELLNAMDFVCYKFKFIQSCRMECALQIYLHLKLMTITSSLFANATQRKRTTSLPRGSICIPGGIVMTINLGIHSSTTKEGIPRKYLSLNHRCAKELHTLMT